MNIISNQISNRTINYVKKYNSKSEYYYKELVNIKGNKKLDKIIKKMLKKMNSDLEELSKKDIKLIISIILYDIDNNEEIEDSYFYFEPDQLYNKTIEELPYISELIIYIKKRVINIKNNQEKKNREKLRKELKNRKKKKKKSTPKKRKNNFCVNDKDYILLDDVDEINNKDLIKLHYNKKVHCLHKDSVKGLLSSDLMEKGYMNSVSIDIWKLTLNFTLYITEENRKILLDGLKQKYNTFKIKNTNKKVNKGLNNKVKIYNIEVIKNKTPKKKTPPKNYTLGQIYDFYKYFF